MLTNPEPLTLLETLTFRPLRMEDAESVAVLTRLCKQHDEGKTSEVTAEDIREEWQADSTNFEADTLAAVNAEGRVVAYISVWDGSADHVNIWQWGDVHPDYQNEALRLRMLDFAEQRAQQIVPLAPEHARVALMTGVSSLNEGYIEFLTRNRFQRIRAWNRMMIELDKQPIQPTFPDGITIRIHDGSEADDRLAYDLIQTSFKDHYGSVTLQYEKWIAALKGAHFDPTLWFFAFEGDTPAGASLCSWELEEDKSIGWVDDLGVLREYRRNGLGLALLLHSFQEFYRRGKPRVGLGVDATSLTGANKLYEKAGMHVARTSYSFEKEMRPGVDLVTRTA